MQEKHFSMVRLYSAAASKKVTGQSAVARALNVSPQRVKNWESRGLSETGARLAQGVFGCDANWLLKENAPGFEYDTAPAQRPLPLTESNVQYLPPAKPDPMTSEMLALFARLDTSAKAELLTFMRGFVAGRSPHQDGAASVSAG